MSLMIDWVTCRLPFTHTKEIHEDLTLRVKPSGEISLVRKDKVEITGSFDSSLYVSTDTDSFDVEKGVFRRVLFTGNPNKFLQGHNVVGSLCLFSLLNASYRRIREYLGLSVEPVDILAISGGHFSVSRLDLTASWAVGSSSADVMAWIRACERYSTLQNRGRGSFSGDTLYFGKHSRRWALKIYSKSLELLKHPPDSSISGVERLLTFADNLLRIEIVFRGLELETAGLKTAADIYSAKLENVYKRYLKRLNLGQNAMIKSVDLEQLKPRQAQIYSLWLEGHDIRQYMSRATWYRYHRFFLDNYGINIQCDVNRQIERDRNVIPLLRTLEAEPVTIPADIRPFVFAA